MTMTCSRIFVAGIFCCVLILSLWQASSAAAVPRLVIRRSAGEEASNCIKCPPGTFVTKACYAGVASLCKRCPKGTFTAYPHLMPECEPCSQCSPGWYKTLKCISTRDTVCREQNITLTTMDEMLGDDPTTANQVQPTLDDITEGGSDVVDTNGDEVVEKVVPDEVKLTISPSDKVISTPLVGEGEEEGEGSGDADETILAETKPEENEGEAAAEAVPLETQTPAPLKEAEIASPDPVSESDSETPDQEPAVQDITLEKEEGTAENEDNVLIVLPEDDVQEEVDQAEGGKTGAAAPETPQPIGNETAAESDKDGSLAEGKADDVDDKTPTEGTPTLQTAIPLAVPDEGANDEVKVDVDDEEEDKDDGDDDTIVVNGGDEAQPGDTAGEEENGEAQARGSIPGAVLKGADMGQGNETDVKPEDDDESIPDAALQAANQNGTDADEGVEPTPEGEQAKADDVDDADDDDGDDDEDDAEVEEGDEAMTRPPGNETDDDDTPAVVPLPPIDEDGDDNKDDNVNDADNKKTTDDGELVVGMSEPTGEEAINKTDDSGVGAPVVLEPSEGDKDVMSDDADDKEGDDALPVTTSDDSQKTTPLVDTDGATPATVGDEDGKEGEKQEVDDVDGDDVADQDHAKTSTTSGDPREPPSSVSPATTPASTSALEPTLADDKDKGDNGVVVVVHPPSTTRRIPTLEEVDTTRSPDDEVIDVGSGDAPPLVVDGGEKGEEPEKEAKPEKGEEPEKEAESEKGEEHEKEQTSEKEVEPDTEAGSEKNATSEEEETRDKEEGGTGVIGHETGDEQEGDEGDVVAIGEGDEDGTRELPGRPGDGTRRGQGVRVVVLEENEEEEEDEEEDEEGNETNPKIDARKGDTEEDEESKKRTALIVGVAIGGVALFTLGFFTTRHCKQRRKFKLMKKVPQDSGATNGREDSIEFRPMHGSTGIYDEVDEVGTRNGNGSGHGSYRKIKENSYRPVPSSAPPAATTAPSSAKTPSSFTAPNGDTYAVVNKNRQPPPPRKINDPHVAPNERIPFIDESTDDERDDPKPIERLLPKKPMYAALPEVQEEESRIQPPEPAPMAEPEPVSEPEPDVQPSGSGDIIQNADKKMANGGSGGKIGNDLAPPSPKGAGVKNAVARSKSVEVEV